MRVEDVQSKQAQLNGLVRRLEPTMIYAEILPN